MSWKIIRICDRCCDAKMMDYENVDIKKVRANNEDYVLRDKCLHELRELNQKLDNYVDESCKNFFRRSV